MIVVADEEEEDGNVHGLGGGLEAEPRQEGWTRPEQAQ
jgi:hypothetical protein